MKMSSPGESQGKRKLETRTPSFDDDDDNREMDMLEFIRTVDRECRGVQSLVENSRSSSQSSSISSVGRIKSESNERKHSADGLKILKPSHRMKAFKNRRQQTFHSLEAYNVDEKSLTTDDVVSEDVLKMPAIESLKLSSPKTALKNAKKNYQKIHSDPSLVANRSNSSTNVKRILHTIEQPDGSVIGYCTEQPLTPTPNSGSSSSSSKNDVQPLK